MTFYHHGNQDSPWSTLDPSLKQFAIPIPSDGTKSSYLEFPHFTTLTKLPEREEKVHRMQDYLNEIKEIEQELILHRNSIYTEKLKVLEEELVSIENESHKEIKKADKQITKIRDQTLATHEAMYNYELQAIEIQVNHEKEIIKGDLERNIGLARKVITSENVIPTKKRKEKSPFTHSESEETDEEEEPPQYKRIHLSKKLSKLKAISERQRNKKPLESELELFDQKELNRDFLLMKQAIKK